MNYNDSPINERLEVLVARPKDFFNKKIHLYRGSMLKVKDKMVTPTFLNNGTKLSTPRASSFWTDDIRTVYLYLFAHSAGKMLDKMKSENEMVLKHGFTYKRNIIVLVKNKEDIPTIKENIIKENIKPMYLYEVTVSGNDKDLGIGRNTNMREFTIDRPIKADKETKFTSIPKEVIEDMFIFTDNKEEYMKLLENRDQTDTVGKLEQMLKKNESPFNVKNSLKTKFFLNEFINAVNNKKYSDIAVVADRHIGADIRFDKTKLNLVLVMKQAEELGKEINKLLSNGQYVLFLGDIIDKRWISEYHNIMSALFAGLSDWYKVIYVLGNSEDSLSPKEIMDNALFKNTRCVFWAGYKIETDKFIFTHAPVLLRDKKINIHAHLHGITKYWVEPKNHMDVWKAAPSGKAMLLKDILDQLPKTDKDNKLVDNPPTLKDMKNSEIMRPMYKLYKHYNMNESVHWDTLLTKPNMYNKQITLYRMGHVKDDKVYPFGRSVGNKLWKGGYSSWWAEQPDETMLHFSQQARALLDDFKEHCYMVAAPDDGRGYKRSVLYLDKEYYYQNLPVLNKIEFYRYTKTFNVKDLHRGQEYAVHEWTYPDLVIPDKVETLHANDCIKNGSVVLVDDLEKIKHKYPNQPKYIADVQDKPWLYYEYSKVKKMLKANKEKGLTLNPKYADIFVPPENLKAKILKKKK